MTARTRFLRSVIATAQQTEAQTMPWTRGAARRATIARRAARITLQRRSA